MVRENFVFHRILLMKISLIFSLKKKKMSERNYFPARYQVFLNEAKTDIVTFNFVLNFFLSITTQFFRDYFEGIFSGIKSIFHREIKDFTKLGPELFFHCCEGNILVIFSSVDAITGVESIMEKFGSLFFLEGRGPKWRKDLLCCFKKISRYEYRFSFSF